MGCEGGKQDTAFCFDEMTYSPSETVFKLFAPKDAECYVRVGVDRLAMTLKDSNWTATAKGDRIFMQGYDAISFPNPKKLVGECVLAVRPEQITLSKTGGMVEGVMNHRFYMGDSVDYRIKVKDHIVRVIQKGASYETYQDGETVYLDFDNVMSFAKDD